MGREGLRSVGRWFVSEVVEGCKIVRRDTKREEAVLIGEEEVSQRCKQPGWGGRGGRRRAGGDGGMAVLMASRRRSFNCVSTQLVLSLLKQYASLDG